MMLRGKGRLFAYDTDGTRLRHLEAGAKRVGLKVSERERERVCLFARGSQGEYNVCVYVCVCVSGERDTGLDGTDEWVC